MNPIIVVLIVFAILIAFVIYFASKFRMPTKYLCTPGACTLSSSGTFDTVDECMAKCPSAPVNSRYSCINPGTCALTTDGLFMSMDDCMKNCKL